MMDASICEGFRFVFETLSPFLMFLHAGIDDLRTMDSKIVELQTIADRQKLQFTP